MKMEEVKSGATFVQLLVAFLTAILGLIVTYSIYSKRHDSETVKKEAAAELAAKSQAPVPAQPTQVSKKSVASAKLKALAAERVCTLPLVAIIYLNLVDIMPWLDLLPNSEQTYLTSHHQTCR